MSIRLATTTSEHLRPGFATQGDVGWQRRIRRAATSSRLGLPVKSIVLMRQAALRRAAHGASAAEVRARERCPLTCASSPAVHTACASGSQR
jgi:hypothetical protein